MSSKVTFAFDHNPLGVYYAGQVISGTAELITERPKTIRSIFITVSGFGETRWQESVEKTGADGKPTKTLETHTTTEVYYSSDKYVYGQSGGSQLELPKGKYVFPFQATMPPNAPTSFNGEHGQIKHEVTLTIDRAVRYNNTFQRGFTVILPHDLNQHRENMKPLKRIEEKSFWWGSIFGGKPLIMDVSATYSAYVPGQKIHFKIVLDNQSDVQCQDVKVRLFKNVCYRANSAKTEQFKNRETRIADKHCGEVMKHNKAEFNEFLLVPPTTPTTLAQHDPIRVSYTLRFIAKTFRLHGGGDLIIDFPLVIGTVPLLGCAEDKGPAQAQPSPNGYQPLPQPNFQEDISEEHFEASTYKPRYPVYLFGSSAQKAAAAAVLPSSTPSLYPKAEDLSKQPAVHYTPNPVIASYSTPTVSPSAPARNNAPYPTNNTPVPAKAAAGGAAAGGTFEVLGFSLPPDYKPTPSAPVGAGGNIGWK